MFPADHLVPMARAAEANGFDSIAVPDSVFYPEAVSADYPYSADGGRFWTAETPFVDPFIAMGAMAAVTERIELTTNVVKLPIRDPLLVAKQVASLAAISNDRVSLGVGLSWMPEEFRYTHTDMRTRGKRCDEMIDILRLVCGGGGPRFVEYHGRYYDFDPLMISPAPQEPVRIIVGGLSEPGLRRAARLADGWISVQNTTAEITAAITDLARYRAEYGTADRPFSLNVLATDAFDLDGYHRLADLGVTEIQTVPWYFVGGDPNDLQVRLDSLAWFADTIMSKF
jgi:probable F420-dependent oxidoreductase